MNRRTLRRAGTAGLAALCLAMAGVAARTAAGEDAPQREHPHHGHAAHGAAPAEPNREPVSGRSVYQLDATWTNQHGEEITLSSLAGKPVVLAMVYTHCEHACPRIIADIRRIRKQLDDADPGPLALVLVSIDPERDTPERLRSFAETTGLDAQGWLLLRGEASDVQTLAAVFGVSYRRISPTDFAHSNLISVLDRRGEIVHQQVGLGVDPRETVARIRALWREASE